MWRTLQFVPSGSSHGAVPPGNLAGTRDTPFPPAPLLPDGGRLSTPAHSPNAQGALPQSTSLANATGVTNTPSQASPAAVPPSAAGTENATTANIREPLHETTLRSHTSQAVQESLQGIVRHQLEMLVTPALRWEGDVWSGLFMALMIQLPPGHQDRPGAEDTDQQKRNAEQQGWRSEIDLNIAGLGRLQASLWMKANSVEIDLRVAHDRSRQELENGLDSLRSRLSSHGFEEIKINLNRLEEEQVS
ncbi:flagellar hook-length control protein FliK [Halomonas sp. LR5S13]|uniref:flagellar hook-length control protein FliK n=1 Tax=Halomonas rhizosphaerae TaxID=3043296 RepID=UPI0024A8F470|nr:flagellar hook-length control protein FliK [Halomonas rhizosphaerae]MDI5922829.1 flagellar hook-length control protein FliK [Halomonas rhizosphaerae]